MNDELTEVERRMLDFTKQHYHYKGAQEDAIRAAFDVSPTLFWQRVYALIDRPEALAYDPVNVKRLRRLMGRSRTA